MVPVTNLYLFIVILLLCTIDFINGQYEWISNDNTSIIDSVATTDIVTTEIAETTTMRTLSRRKRYIAFPEGSSFSVAFCATLGFVGNPSFIYFSWAINWGVAYELPNETFILNQANRKPLLPKAVMLRRHRRDLYNKIEIAIDNMGYNGRECILRALCESSQYFYKKGSNMMEELLRTVFSLPKSKVLTFEQNESNDIMDYDTAHRKGRNKVFCPALYPHCSISLIELALGEYSKPLNYM